MACYLPGISGSIIYNLTGYGSNLVAQSAATWRTCQEGRGMQGLIDPCLATAPAGPALQMANDVSLFWRGSIDADNVNNANFISCTFANTNISPFEAYALFRPSGLPGIISTANSRSGTANAHDSGTVIDTANYGRVYSFGMISRANDGLVRTYTNGIFHTGIDFDTVDPVGTLAYGTAPQIALNGEFNDTTRTPGATSVIACIWTRQLSAAEMLSVHLDPYQFLIFPGDTITAMGSISVFDPSTVAALYGVTQIPRFESDFIVSY